MLGCCGLGVDIRLFSHLREGLLRDGRRARHHGHGLRGRVLPASIAQRVEKARANVPWMRRGEDDGLRVGKSGIYRSWREEEWRTSG